MTRGSTRRVPFEERRHLFVPDGIHLEGSQLVCPDIRFALEAPPATAPGDLLLRFASLKTACEVERFAKEFGLLGLCRHGVPRSHRRPACQPLHARSESSAVREPVDRWLAFARAAEATLEALAERRRGRSPQPSVWERLFAPFKDAPERTVGRRHETQAIATAVNAWCDVAGLRPRFVWTPGTPLWAESREQSIRLDGPDELGTSLAGVLAFQLLQAVAAGNVAVCANPTCGRLYVVEQKPGRTRIYCRRKCAMQVASRRYRAKETGG